MAATNDDMGGVLVLAVGILAWFWWSGRSTTATGVIGATAGSGSSHGRGGKGCNGCQSDLMAGAPISNGGLVNNQVVTAPAGAVSSSTGLAGGTPVVTSRHTPKPVPGSVGTSSGSGQNWTGLHNARAVGITPRNAPAAPQNPSGAGIWVANSTPQRVKA